MVYIFPDNADFNPEFRNSLTKEHEQKMREVAKIIVSISEHRQ